VQRRRSHQEGVVTHARLYDDAQSDNDDDESVNALEAILGHVGQHEDTGCVNDGVDVSVGVNIGAVVGVGVHGQGVMVKESIYVLV